MGALAAAGSSGVGARRDVFLKFYVDFNIGIFFDLKNLLSE